MSKTDKLWSKWASLGGLKASLKRWSCIIFFTDVPFLTYFLQRKIDGIILSWVLKIYQKMLKISEYETFQSFSSIFGDIGCICFQKLFVFKNYQNFQMYNLWMSTILGHFRPFWGAFELSGKYWKTITFSADLVLYACVLQSKILDGSILSSFQKLLPSSGNVNDYAVHI